ncbi:NAD(P)H nitroreductase [Paraferrimonas sp. SM1919]|uniref:NAD(P)H nitroreductase n=1 Tax=Paraferrimonas sp. SM1919 TaxID=2662263 RepID=UPI0013D1CCE7|nr:NAD(P)H nitroreductase [Paraferrimonas sp. SM1919]
MQALELLLQRQSCPKLTAPAPNAEQLQTILQAGSRAPDHANLSPWEFIVVQDEGLAKLTDILVDAAHKRAEPQASIDKAKVMAYRAPMIIVVIAKVSEHPKVPIIEQHLSAGCAVMAMQMAAQAQGLNGIWRTGTPAFDNNVKQALGATGDDEIVGFLYLGTPSCEIKIKPNKDLSKVVRYL